jgi:hypothetical protein
MSARNICPFGDHQTSPLPMLACNGAIAAPGARLVQFARSLFSICDGLRAPSRDALWLRDHKNTLASKRPALLFHGQANASGFWLETIGCFFSKRTHLASCEQMTQRVPFLHRYPRSQ